MLDLSTEPKFCMHREHWWKLMYFLEILLNFHVLQIFSEIFLTLLFISMAGVVHACI